MWKSGPFVGKIPLKKSIKILFQLNIATKKRQGVFACFVTQFFIYKIGQRSAFFLSNKNFRSS